MFDYHMATWHFLLQIFFTFSFCIKRLFFFQTSIGDHFNFNSNTWRIWVMKISSYQLPHVRNHTDMNDVHSLFYKEIQGICFLVEWCFSFFVLFESWKIKRYVTTGWSSGLMKLLQSVHRAVHFMNESLLDGHAMLFLGPKWCQFFGAAKGEATCHLKYTS